MGENSKIGWTDHTWNIWIGCAKVSEGCKFCYAETFAKRYFPGTWGAKANRIITKTTWRNPRKWNKKALIAGRRERVFINSLSDFFEDLPILEETREQAWKVIRECAGLDFLIVTKRPENISMFLPRDWGNGYQNVWIGTTVENQEMAKLRIPILMKVPAKVRFISAEPLLEAIDIREGALHCYSVPTKIIMGRPAEHADPGPEFIGLDWVIVGGESGFKKDARAFNVSWAQRILEHCQKSKTAFFMKQLGVNAVRPSNGTGKLEKLPNPGNDSKGEELTSMPVQLRVQEFPEVFVKTSLL